MTIYRVFIREPHFNEDEYSDYEVCGYEDISVEYFISNKNAWEYATSLARGRNHKKHIFEIDSEDEIDLNETFISYVYIQKITVMEEK